MGRHATVIIGDADALQFRFVGQPTQIGGRNEYETLVDTKTDDPKTMLLDGSLNPIA
jgi:hypothetical protein